ncbi:putative motility protein [Halomonas sp. HP20-15]|uniref:putative motility protein n=1 Tax=Halomonas sp. HP20-15 TaxID=3085901 RepID=UPI0029819CC7|nr:putative motility protein [Halomonas sp. HP20-15]MDW5376619.1 putative motility protein [Halomonas sp. HP20-15]
MDLSINNTVGAAVALQQYNADQSAQMSLLRQSLDTQGAQIAQLMESVGDAPKLASVGSVGTQLNTYA